MNNISPHITYTEATKSQTATRKGIENIPNEEQLANMKNVAIKCFEPIRVWYMNPLIVSSFFRCEKLNSSIGGAKNSQHVSGEAIDIDTNSRADNKKIFEWAKNNLIFDQLIFEYGDESGPDWVHVSLKRSGVNRQQVLYIKK